MDRGGRLEGLTDQPSGRAKILYAHLGGAPTLNDYSYAYRNG